MPTLKLPQLEPFLDDWAARLWSCQSADRAATEAGLEMVYAAAGLRPPKFVWCGSPLEIASCVRDVGSADPVGSNVKAEIFDQPLSRVETWVELYWTDVLIAANRLSNARTTADRTANRYASGRALGIAIQRTVDNGADDLLSPFSVRARHAVRWSRGLPRVLPRARFSDVAIGPHEMHPVGVYAYLRDILGWQDPTRSMIGLEQIALSGIWIVPHEHVCWISPPPTQLRTDGGRRLHAADGAALRYPDGWSVFAWKGVPVPSWTIECPEKITASTIANTFDPVLRNCLIEIMTPERFVACGAPRRLAEDATGVLWHKEWRFRGATIGVWSAVEVVNGTAEADGSHKRYFLRVPHRMRTAREAVAWTYGLTAEQYSHLELRT